MSEEPFDPRHPDRAHEDPALETDDPADYAPVRPGDEDPDRGELPDQIPDPDVDDQAGQLKPNGPGGPAREA